MKPLLTSTVSEPGQKINQITLHNFPSSRLTPYFGAQVGRRHRVAGARGAGRRFKKSGGRAARALRRLALLNSRVSRIPARRGELSGATREDGARVARPN